MAISRVLKNEFAGNQEHISDLSDVTPSQIERGDASKIWNRPQSVEDVCNCIDGGYRLSAATTYKSTSSLVHQQTSSPRDVRESSRSITDPACRQPSAHKPFQTHNISAFCFGLPSCAWEELPRDKVAFASSSPYPPAHRPHTPLQTGSSASSGSGCYCPDHAGTTPYARRAEV
jgi:hypothetical protein